MSLRSLVSPIFLFLGISRFVVKSNWKRGTDTLYYFTYSCHTEGLSTLSYGGSSLYLPYNHENKGLAVNAIRELS